MQAIKHYCGGYVVTGCLKIRPGDDAFEDLVGGQALLALIADHLAQFRWGAGRRDHVGDDGLPQMGSS